MVEKGKLDTECCEDSSLKAEVSCPESKKILKYIHKKFGKRNHYEDSSGPSQVFMPASGNRKRKSVIIQNTKGKMARTEDADEELFTEPIHKNNQDASQINFDTELQVMNKLAKRNLIEDESHVLDKLRQIFD